MRKQQLLRQLVRAAGAMVQGGLSETTRRCGNLGCICYRDPARRHGPHLYLTYRSAGKSRALYVPAERTEEARRAQADWKQFWEIGCAIAAGNREQLRQRWAGRKGKAARRRARG